MAFYKIFIYFKKKIKNKNIFFLIIFNMNFKTLKDINKDKKEENG